jgi:ABC-type nitrate/sulfonate/bicarbonate transport system substrate-binding protein
VLPPTRRRPRATTRRAALGALLAGSAAALAACSAQPEPPAPDPTEVDLTGATLRVGALAGHHAISPWLWPRFAPEGVGVEVVAMATGGDLDVALQRGDLDFAVFGVPEGLVLHAEGIASKIVCGAHLRGSSLVVLDDGPVAGVPDLRGRRVAVRTPSFEHLLLREVLDAVGSGAEGELEIVTVEDDDAQAALDDGDVEAVMAAEPLATRLLRGGGRRLVEDLWSTPVGELAAVVWASPTALAREGLAEAACAMQRGAALALSPEAEEGTTSTDVALWREVLTEHAEASPGVAEDVAGRVAAIWDLDDDWQEQVDAQAEALVARGLLADVPSGRSVMDLRRPPDA